MPRPAQLQFVLWLMFALLLAARGVQFWAAPPFSPDSWSYWELAQSVGREFYRIHTWRQFQFEAPYGVSFPPLWPIMIAAADSVVGLGYRTAIALNMLIAMLTAAALQGFCAGFGSPHGHAPVSRAAGNMGLLIACALLANRSYCEELFAGRAMPLSLLLFIALLWQLHSAAAERDSPSASSLSISPPLANLGRTVLLSSTVALATLNRFDFLPAMLALSVLVPALLLRTNDHRWRTSALTVTVWWAALAMWLLPWAGYGLEHFGRAFVSDNSRTVLAAVPTHVDDFYVAPLPTVFNAPLDWAAKTAHGALTVLGTLLRPMAVNLLLLVLLLSTAVTLLRAQAHELWGPRRVWLYCDLAMAAQMSSVLLAGFATIRYALPLEAYLLVRLAALLPADSPNSTRLMPCAAGAVLLQCALLVVPPTRPWLNPVRPAVNLHAYAQVAACLRNATDARVLFLTDNNEHAYRFGALYAVDTLGTPHNYRTARLDVLVRKFGVTHVFDELNAPLQPSVAARLNVSQQPACELSGLARIQSLQ